MAQTLNSGRSLALAQCAVCLARPNPAVPIQRCAQGCVRMDKPMNKEEKYLISQDFNISLTAFTRFYTVVLHKILWLTPEQRRIYCVANRRDAVCGTLDCSREVEILVARLVSLGVAIGLSSLVGLGLLPLSTAHAAHSVWAAYAAQPKRPQFRPLNRTGRKSVSSRWRPHAAAAPRNVNPTTATRTAGSSTGYVRQTPFMLDPYGSRHLVRSTPDTGFGARFRPQRRGSTGTESPAVHTGTQMSGHSARLQSQFRPTRTQRRSSYEELQSGKTTTRRALAQRSTYPVVSARGAFGYAGHWPGW